MNDGFQYGDLIFLGVIAAFIILRLRATLGKDAGINPQDILKNAVRNISQDKVINFPGGKNKEQPVDDLIPENLQDNKTIVDALRAIKAADSGFSTTEFISGAKTAFEWLVDAFAKGDKDKLGILLANEPLKHFVDEIDQRSTQESYRETTLVSIESTDIIEASLNGKIVRIGVQFTSEQINVMRDKDKNLVGGDPSNIETAVDVWTFERDVSSRDPNWKIIAT
ncbi:MAG: Tim44/TimA family putative adaptor protein [Pseudomonadota bacterium]